MLFGNKIRLRAQEKRDMPFINTMYNDPKVGQFDLNFLAGFSLDFMEKDFEKTKKESLEDTRRERFVIETYDADPVGGISYFIPDETKNIFVIGITVASNCWSSGYGQDAINALLKYLFLKRAALKVELFVRDTNSRAVHCYEKCGFVKEALLRDTDFSGGKPISMQLMGVLREEFLKRGDL